MLLIEIILTVVAWNRGWRWRALRPIAFGAVAGVVAAAAGIEPQAFVLAALLIDLGITGWLVSLAIHPPNSPATDWPDGRTLRQTADLGAQQPTIERRAAMKALTPLIVILVLSLSFTAAPAASGVNLYIYENFTDGYHFASTVRNLSDYENSYETTCEYENKWGMPRTRPCTKKIPMNDNMRAVEILNDGITVEIYEHKNFGGQHITYRGAGKYVFPAWFWDRASSIAIY